MERPGVPWAPTPTSLARSLRGHSRPGAHPHCSPSWGLDQDTESPRWVERAPEPSREGTDVPTAGSALARPLCAPRPRSPAEKHVSWAIGEDSCLPSSPAPAGPPLPQLSNGASQETQPWAEERVQGGEPGCSTALVRSVLSEPLSPRGKREAGLVYPKASATVVAPGPLQPQGCTADARSLQRVPNSGLGSSTYSLPQAPRGPAEPQPEECEPFPASPPLWPARRGAGASGPL